MVLEVQLIDQRQGVVGGEQLGHDGVLQRAVVDVDLEDDEVGPGGDGANEAQGVVAICVYGDVVPVVDRAQVRGDAVPHVGRGVLGCLPGPDAVPLRVLLHDPFLTSATAALVVKTSADVEEEVARGERFGERLCWEHVAFVDEVRLAAKTEVRVTRETDERLDRHHHDVVAGARVGEAEVRQHGVVAVLDPRPGFFGVRVAAHVGLQASNAAGPVRLPRRLDVFIENPRTILERSGDEKGVDSVQGQMRCVEYDARHGQVGHGRERVQERRGHGLW